MLSVFIVVSVVGSVVTNLLATLTNLFLHTLVPITSIVLFAFVNMYYNVKFKAIFFTLLPVFIYATMYFILEIAISKDDGGWRGHYHFHELMPWYYIAMIMFALTFGLANLLKSIHNYMHRRDKALTEQYLHNLEEYNFDTM